MPRGVDHAGGWHGLRWHASRWHGRWRGICHVADDVASDYLADDVAFAMLRMTWHLPRWLMMWRLPRVLHWPYHMDHFKSRHVSSYFAPHIITFCATCLPLKRFFVTKHVHFHHGIHPYHHKRHQKSALYFVFFHHRCTTAQITHSSDHTVVHRTYILVHHT